MLTIVAAAPERSDHEVIIVGGGILGQAVAHELACEGAVEFLHVYPRGYGRDCATSAAGAMISAFGEVTDSEDGALAERKLEFRALSQDAYAGWLRGIRARSARALPIHRGIFMIANAHGHADRTNLVRLTAALDRFGRAWQHVRPEDVPGLAPDGAHAPDAAVFVQDDFSIDSIELLDALASSVAAEPRARILHASVRSVRSIAGGRWEIETVDGDRHRARELVLCAGAHIPDLLGESMLAELALPPLYFAKGIGFVVSGAPPVPHAIRTPNRSDACGVHIVPRRDGRLYIGASTHYGHATAAARGFTPGEVNAILGDTLTQIDSRLRDATIEQIRYGLRPIAGGEAPLIGRTCLAGVSLATGTFRTGIVMAPLIARLVVDQLLGREAAFGNPFPVEQQFGEPPASGNLALFHLNRGLRAYQALKLDGCAERRAEALAHWQLYCALAGDDRDPRIVELMSTIDGQAPPNSSAAFL